MTDWLGKPYYSLDAYLKKTFGEKVYKLSLDGGMTCPNRDGTCGDRGWNIWKKFSGRQFRTRRSWSFRSERDRTA